MYSRGSEYLQSLNLNEYYYGMLLGRRRFRTLADVYLFLGWRDVGITAIFACSSYLLVFVLMRLRTKATKKASS